MKAAGAGNAVEQGRLGRGHPNLLVALEPVEQGGAPVGVEMGGDLVEQQDRRSPPSFRDQLGMGQHEAEQQRLLLAGRATAA